MNEFIEERDKKTLKRGIRKASSKTSAGLLLFFILMNAAAVGAVALSTVLFKDANADTLMNVYAPLYNTLLYAVIYLIFCPLGILLINRLNGSKVKDFTAKPKVGAGFTFKWIIIGVGGTTLVNLVITMLTGILAALGIELHPIVPEAIPSIWGMLATILGFAGMAPIMEELLFRGAMLNSTKKCGEAFAIVMTAVFFGLYHTNYTQLFYTFTLGLVCGFVAVKAKSIWPAFFVHLTLNIIGSLGTICISYLPAELMNPATELTMEEQMKLIAGNPLPLIGTSLIGMLNFSLAIAAIVLFIIELVKHKDSFKLENACPELKWGEKLLAYFSSPATLILAALLLAMTVVNAMGIGA